MEILITRRGLDYNSWKVFYCNAELEELQKWKDHNTYKTVVTENLHFIILRWVYSKKVVDGKAKVKSRLVDRGFQESNESTSKDSPKCSKETIYLILNIIASFAYPCQLIDTKSAL